jgi:predicted amidophosphoribosyltransferase
MRCSVCHAENPDKKRFCGDCGAPLSANVKVCQIPAERLSSPTVSGDI